MLEASSRVGSPQRSKNVSEIELPIPLFFHNAIIHATQHARNWGHSEQHGQGPQAHGIPTLGGRPDQTETTVLSTSL